MLSVYLDTNLKMIKIIKLVELMHTAHTPDCIKTRKMLVHTRPERWEGTKMGENVERSKNPIH